jgi:D-alanyl-D-alanine carboxypeptidase
VTISRILLNSVDENGKITDGKKPYYEDISFALKAPEITVAIAESDSAVTVPTVEFVSNLDAYEEYMNPGTTTEFLTLVNPEHVLDENYVPVGLVRLSYGEGLLMKDYAANAFEAMMIEARACGITGLTATKAYVSYSDTLVKFNEVVDEYVNLLGREQARRYAASTVASPGTDEHQSGLAVNLGLTSGIALEDSTAYSWLKENSEKFGFILRYPDGKSGILEAKPDPTQFRYVGRYHAVRINDLEMTLDEYCKYLGL